MDHICSHPSKHSNLRSGDVHLHFCFILANKTSTALHTRQLEKQLPGSPTFQLSYPWNKIPFQFGSIEVVQLIFLHRVSSTLEFHSRYLPGGELHIRNNVHDRLDSCKTPLSNCFCSSYAYEYWLLH